MTKEQNKGNKQIKIIMWMATSLNGKIARKNGSEDFLSESNWKDFSAEVNKSGFLIWGRKTYEAVSKWENKYINSLKKNKIIIVSRKNNANSRILTVKSPKEAIRIAKKLGAKSIVLSGGSTLNKSFLKEKLVDEVILNINPVIIGEGISLSAEDNYLTKLKLITIVKKKDILQLRYKVRK